jgi:hypothetical protein
MTDDMTQLRAEQAWILALPGRVAWVKLARLNRTAKILRGNAKVLLDHLNRMDDVGYMLATTSDQQAFEEFLDETERHLHNYVAAAQSRVDHFRQFPRAEWPEGSPQREEYQRRVDEEFKTSPLHNFVTNLRNLILHVRLPVSTTIETWGPDAAWSFRVMLDSADLLGWDGWSAERSGISRRAASRSTWAERLGPTPMRSLHLIAGWPSASSGSTWRRSSPISAHCGSTRRGCVS